MVGAWNGNSDNSLVSRPGAPLFSIDVTTYVWQGFLEEATKGWTINGFGAPNGLDVVAVDPWTGLLPSPGGKSVDELFIRGTAPDVAAAAGGALRRCGADHRRVRGRARRPGWPPTAAG